MSSDINDNTSRKYKLALNYETGTNDYDEIKYNNKMKVECICPKCGIKHKNESSPDRQGSTEEILPNLQREQVIRYYIYKFK